MTEILLLDHMLNNAKKGLPVGDGLLNRHGQQIASTELAVIDLSGWRELSIQTQPELEKTKGKNP